MIDKEFAPYEQALALKELGFDEPCLAWFSETKKLQIAPETYKKWTGKPCNNSNIINVFNVDCISAPTFSQAFRWFREKYNLASHIATYWQHDWNNYSYQYYFVQDKVEWNGIEHYKTYEEAELACLNTLIEIVKNK